MTATGSHIDSYSLRGAQPPGEALRHAISAYRIRAGGACPRPYKATPEVRTKPSPAYRGWHGVSRDGCGGDQVRFTELSGNLLRPTSVSPDGLPPSPQGEGFPLKPLRPTPILAHSPSLPIGQTAPSKRGPRDCASSQCVPPLIRPLRGHLPPREGFSQRDRRPAPIFNISQRERFFNSKKS